MWLLIIVTLLAGLLSVSGGLLIVLWPKMADKLQKWLSLLLIVVLSLVVFTDLVPEAMEEGLELWQVFGWLLLGAGVFWLLQKLLERHHRHGHDAGRRKSESVKAQAQSVWLADSLHAVMDGLVIGTAWLAGAATGGAAVLSVVAHEIPQNIGDFMALKRAKYARKWVILLGSMNIVTMLLGAVLAFALGEDWFLYKHLGPVLAVVAGFFLNIVLREMVILYRYLKTPEFKIK
jgi:zinc and cadmium transporter